MSKYTQTPPADTTPRRAKAISPLKRGMRAGKNVIHGRMISIDFFSRHWIGVAIAVLLLVWYITNKYECRTSMERVQALERQLEIVRGDYVNEHSTYMSRIREGAMEELAQKNNLNLRVQDEPPYKLHYQNPSK
ncbi:MAG: hypothetical protein HDS75_06475 [Bacteroidales bacterium]|nr:hypothetical protein [Bacteroidales bacterium]